MEYYKTLGGRDISDHKNETRDCVVRAFTLAMDLKYNTAHKLCKDQGRKNNKPMYGTRWFLEKYGVLMLGENYRTLGQFVKAKLKGRYIILTRGHAQAVINGCLFDAYYKPAWKSRIQVIVKMNQS